MENIMLDIETLGTRSTSCILSIGAVYFDEHNLGETFYRNIDIKRQEKLGFTKDESTLNFWMKQEKEVFDSLLVDRVSIEDALIKFTSFINNKRTIKVWGCGSPFDNVIVRNAYEVTDIEVPWMWWNDRCFRTMKNIFKNVFYKSENELKHNALYDAIDQAKQLITIMKAINQGALK